MKIRIALFLTFTFIGLLSLPTVFSLLDNTTELVSMVDNTEEENKNEELEKDIELELYNNAPLSFLHTNTSAKENVKNTMLYYCLELAKKNTPPPELVA